MTTKDMKKSKVCVIKSTYLSYVLFVNSFLFLAMGKERSLKGKRELQKSICDDVNSTGVKKVE